MAGINFKAFDLGGHEIARRVWKDYYAKVSCVVPADTSLSCFIMRTTRGPLFALRCSYLQASWVTDMFSKVKQRPVHARSLGHCVCLHRWMHWCSWWTR